MTEFEANPTALVGELLLIAVGAVLLWRQVLSPAAQRARITSPLSPWDAPASDFVLFLLLVICGALTATLLGGWLASALHLKGDPRTALGWAASQFGMLAGGVVHNISVTRYTPQLRLTRCDFLTGSVAFLITLTVATAAGLGWAGLLKLLGLPAEQQDSVEMFTHAKSPVFLAALIALTALVAPVTEELIFRAGLFRFLRTRLPRWGAIALPSIIFASLHVFGTDSKGLASFGPLVALAVVFSLAYERTGRIATPIVAHALFNLHTIVLIFAGVAK